MNLNEDQKKEIIEFLIGIYNDIYMESGQIEGTRPNIKHIVSILERKLPSSLKKSKAGLIQVIHQ